MLAILGAVLLVIAAFLKATAKDPSVMTWLIITGALLVAVETALLWHRSGHTYRRAA